jgi:hypothetical protein
MARIKAVLRDRTNGDPVTGEDVVFKNPGGSALDTVATDANGASEYSANGNPAGQITWSAAVSGDTRQAGAVAQRQIGAFFEAELPRSFLTIMTNGYGDGLGDECAVVPGSGRQVTVGTGCLWVQGIPFHFYDDTNLASSANASLATRLDRVVLRVELDDAATDYGMGTLVYLEGTVNNTLPSITQDVDGTYEYVLANVTSAQSFSSYTEGNISDQRSASGPHTVPLAAIPTGIPQASIDGLVAALALKANAANAALTGTTTATNITASGDVAVGDDLTVTGDANLDGTLNHNGSTIGFFGSAPATQAAGLSAISGNVADATYSATEQAMLNNHTQALEQIVAVLERYGLVP